MVGLVHGRIVCAAQKKKKGTRLKKGFLNQQGKKGKKSAEAQAEEAAASPARALLRESRASRGSRGSPARKDDARGGDTARTPARKDRSPSASSGRAARRRREATPGEVSSAESLEGSDPRVATLRARPAASPPKPSAVASYLAQPAPTAPAAPTQPAPKPAGAACDRHGLKDCFLCSLQGASLTSPLPAPRPGCAVHGVADCPVCGGRGGICGVNHGSSGQQDSSSIIGSRRRAHGGGHAEPQVHVACGH